MIKIRKFSPEDLDRVVAISQGAFAQPWPREAFKKFWQKNPEGFIVAEDENEIAGFSLNNTASNKGTIKLIAVNAIYRGRGIGKSLMEYALGYFAENGVTEVIARSRPHNETGCQFLKSFGFEVTGTLKGYYSNGEDAYLMVKKL